MSAQGWEGVSRSIWCHTLSSWRRWGTLSHKYIVEKGSDLAFWNKCLLSSLILHQNLKSGKFLKVLMWNLKPCQLTVHTVTSNTRGLTPFWCFEWIFYLSLSSKHHQPAIGKHHLPELSRSSQRWHILLYNIKKGNISLTSPSILKEKYQEAVKLMVAESSFPKFKFPSESSNFITANNVSYFPWSIWFTLFVFKKISAKFPCLNSHHFLSAVLSTQVMASLLSRLSYVKMLVRISALCWLLILSQRPVKRWALRLQFNKTDFYCFKDIKLDFFFNHKFTAVKNTMTTITTKNFQMYKLYLETTKEPEIKLPTSSAS